MNELRTTMTFGDRKPSLLCFGDRVSIDALHGSRELDRRTDLVPRGRST